MKKIAIVLCGMEYSNQQEMIDGVDKYCKEHLVDAYVFNCSSRYYAETASKGPFALYQFFSPEDYDGILVCPDMIHYEPAREDVLEVIRQSHTPAISLGAKVPGMGYIGYDNYRAMYKLVSRIIRRHKVKEIAYVHGNSNYEDAMARSRAYRDVLEKEGIPIDKYWYYEGDFSIESGSMAVREFERMNRMPQAIVCANDAMAAGAIMELQDLGYDVPKDVIVTGFYGYCAVAECDLLSHTDILYRWINDLGNYLDDVVKKQAIRLVLNKINSLSETDILTGLYNRIGFQKYIEEYKEESRQTGRSLYISFIDIDGLKIVNDTFGHQVGDELIHSVAECIRDAMKPKEMAMRFGGDEFVVMGLENVAYSRHKQFESDMQENLERKNTGDMEYRVAASIGSYIIEDVDSSDIQSIMDKADAEMYRRKKERKQRQMENNI